MKRYIIKYSTLKSTVEMVEIIRFAEKISGKKLKIEFVNRNHILVELGNCIPIDVIIEEDKILILEQGILKSYLVMLFLYTMKEIGLNVSYKIPYWAKKPFGKIKRWEIWFF